MRTNEDDDFEQVPMFDGVTFEPDRDHDRLARQLASVRRHLSDGDWHTLAEMSATLGHPEASISARMRDLRKRKFGAHIVERRYVSRGLHEYRLVWRTHEYRGNPAPAR